MWFDTFQDSESLTLHNEKEIADLEMKLELLQNQNTFLENELVKSRRVRVHNSKKLPVTTQNIFKFLY